jgi:hypothetical protein
MRPGNQVGTASISADKTATWPLRGRTPCVDYVDAAHSTVTLGKAVSAWPYMPIA